MRSVQKPIASSQFIIAPSFPVWQLNDENTCCKHTIFVYRKTAEQHKVIVARSAFTLHASMLNMLNSKRRYHDLQLVDVTKHEVGLVA
jgi:hypothetical protein